MKNGRYLVILIGITLPYLARLPGGFEWLMPYINIGFSGFLFFHVFNAISWSTILGISFLYRYPSSLLFPTILGFGYLAWAHYRLDLAADAQAGLGMVFIPIYSLAFVAAGGIIGYIVDRLRLKRNNV